VEKVIFEPGMKPGKLCEQSVTFSESLFYWTRTKWLAAGNGKMYTSETDGQTDGQERAVHVSRGNKLESVTSERRY